MYFETNRANHFAIALLLLHFGPGVRFTNCTNHLNQCLPKLIVLSPLFFWSEHFFPFSSVHAPIFLSQLRNGVIFSSIFTVVVGFSSTSLHWAWLICAIKRSLLYIVSPLCSFFFSPLGIHLFVLCRCVPRTASIIFRSPAFNWCECAMWNVKCVQTIDILVAVVKRWENKIDRQELSPGTMCSMWVCHSSQITFLRIVERRRKIWKIWFFSFYYRIQSLFITYLIASYLLRHWPILNEKFQVKIDWVVAMAKAQRMFIEWLIRFMSQFWGNLFDEIGTLSWRQIRNLTKILRENHTKKNKIKENYVFPLASFTHPPLLKAASDERKEQLVRKICIFQCENKH